MKNLMPRQLVIFNAVYETGGFNTAALAVGVTQPAITKSIQALENQLGVKLFDRGASGFRPTRAAEVLRRRIRWIEREIELIDEEIASRNDFVRGHLKLGSNPVWAILFLPLILPKLQTMFPEVSLEVSVGSGESLIPQINDGRLDIFFGVIPETFSDRHVLSHKILEVQIMLFARKDHPITKVPDDLDALWEYPWMAFSQHSELDRNIAELCARLNRDSKGFSLRSMSLASMLAVASQTDHIIFGVDRLKEHMAEHGFVRLAQQLPLPSYRTGLILRESMQELAPIRFILSEVQNYR